MTQYSEGPLYGNNPRKLKDDKGLAIGIILLVFIFLLRVDLHAQNSSERLDSLFTTLAKNNEFNGNVLISEKGSVIYKHSFGFADVERQILNSSQTAFQLASVSKTITVVAILQLKERGKFKIDDPFVKYFPKFPWPQITLRQLLSHTSGLPDYQIFEQRYQENPTRIYTINDLIKTFNDDKRDLLLSREKDIVTQTRDMGSWHYWWRS